VHGLELDELITLWKEQDYKCYACGRVLNHPRIVPNADTRKDYMGNGGNIKIDHDHGICGKREHSCKKCRRGLACHDCNTSVLAERFTPWSLESHGNPGYWLRLLGTEDTGTAISRLTDAIKILAISKISNT